MNKLLAKCVSSVVVCVSLVGCSGGGGDSDGGGEGGGSVFCSTITGGGSTTTSSGPAENVARAADGNLNSYASLRLRSSAQTGSVRATAQSGIVYPAGSVAGAFVSFLNQGSANSTTIRTYLNGVMVESSTPANFIFQPAGSGTDADAFIGFTTRSQFNAVEFSETDSGSSGNADYRVYEICSDGRT